MATTGIEAPPVARPTVRWGLRLLFAAAVGIGVWMVVTGSTQLKDDAQIKQTVSDFLKAVQSGDAHAMQRAMWDPSAVPRIAGFKAIEGIEYHIGEISRDGDARASAHIEISHQESKVNIELSLRREPSGDWKITTITAPRPNRNSELFQRLRAKIERK